MTDTPEFIRWALGHACPLRDDVEWSDPLRTERYLRPLQAFSQAKLDGRICDGICIARVSCEDPLQAKGFIAEEVLDAYGGESFVQTQCGTCPANVVARDHSEFLAGCCGLFECSDLQQLHEGTEEVVHGLGIAQLVRSTFLATKPLWYGLWADSPLKQESAELLRQILVGLGDTLTSCGNQLNDLLAALEVSVQEKIPLFLTYMPRGVADELTWTVVSHCGPL